MQFHHKFHDLRILVANFCCRHLRTFSANFFGLMNRHRQFFRHASVSSPYPCPSVRPSVHCHITPLNGTFVWNIVLLLFFDKPSLKINTLLENTLSENRMVVWSGVMWSGVVWSFFSLFTCSLFTFHFSLFTFHFSLFTFHFSLFT